MSSTDLALNVFSQRFDNLCFMATPALWLHMLTQILIWVKTSLSYKKLWPNVWVGKSNQNTLFTCLWSIDFPEHHFRLILTADSIITQVNKRSHITFIFNSYYPDMGEWTSGQAYAAACSFTHIWVINCLLYPYDVLYPHFKINSYWFSLFSRVRYLERLKAEKRFTVFLLAVV